MGVTMRLRVLGSVEVDDAPVRSARVRRLLALLALEPRRVVPVDRLVAHLWGDDLPDHGEAALHSVVARARRVLGDGVLLTRPPGYVLNLAESQLDATAFADLVASARSCGDPGAAGAMLDRALEFSKGPAYAEFAGEDPFRPAAVRLDELRADAEEARVAADLDLGHPEAAVARLEPLVAAAPLRERRRELLVGALHRSGRAGEALAAVAAYRRLLAEELGLDPGPELQRLEAAVLAGDRPPRPQSSAASTSPAVADAAAPSPGPRLVGRERTLDETVAALLAATGPLTLVGPGGVGKTALARHVAAAVAGEYPDGIVVTELAGVPVDDEVATAVAGSVAAPGASAPGRDPRQRVADVLRGRQALLVLDNCEHVLDAIAALLAVLVTQCPTVAVLATSREPLGVPGERVRPVPPLAEDAAVALFAGRATAACPDFVLSDANRAIVTEACRRLDRLPLALELAAARMRVLSPADLVAQLPDSLHFLRSPRRSGERRHRTLHAVVDWSYRLLEPRERAMLDRLSVFAGAFTLAAARTVAGLGEPEHDPGFYSVLADLVDKSLLSAAVDHARGGTTRYMLLETVRAYARERLDERGEAAIMRRRHAEHALALVARCGALAGPEALDRVEAIDAEWAEVRAAVAWAGEYDPVTAASLVAGLMDYADVRMSPEVFRWADQLLARYAVAALGPDAPTIFAVAAGGARFAGDLHRAGGLIDAGLAMASEPDDVRRRHLLYLRAECEGFLGRVESERASARELLRLGASAGDGRACGLAEVDIALSLAYAGHVDEALVAADAVAVRARESGDRLLAAWAAYVAGEVRAEIEPDAALALVEEAVRLGRAVGDRYVTGTALVTATSLRARRGDLARAARSAAETLEHWRGTGNHTHQWVGLRHVVELLVRAERDGAAAELLGGLVARRSGGALFGADAHRLAKLRAALVAREGAEAVTAAETAGASRGDDDLVELARTELAHLAEPRPEAASVTLPRGPDRTQPRAGTSPAQPRAPIGRG